MFVLYALVFVLTVFIGVFAIGLGILIGLDPVGVFIAATLSSLIYVWVVLTGGSSLLEKLFPSAMTKLESRADGSRAEHLVDRWGVPGLAVVGSVVLGPTLTLISALLLGVDRKRFAWWYTGSTVVSFAVFTALWTLFWDAVL